ncbi:MAG TPA: single-stranded DNA-binding protein [Sphaerochaeta sp.]|nr:MAG: single-stranded DNA-binding protein [Spirochaetes bacterium GWC2_52_13]HCG63306.1 single-stranded DNA-binding protein [Sphaerochaeta sp.]HCS36608.1 single-stranded DNA-binding protein [Sphaerochaeta sp.]
MEHFTENLLRRTRTFAGQVDALEFDIDGYVYNPLSYAWDMHEAYLKRYVHQGVPVLFLGMNPGPFGMAQTGVPFGEVVAVREWMALDKPVGKPPAEHPARPVKGLEIGRSEVSGKRLWSLMAQRYGTAQAFFARHAVMNYCPLVFVDAGKGGRNVIPEKLPKPQRTALEALCDAYLDDMVSLIAPKYLVGVGLYAKRKLQESNKRLGGNRTVCAVLHPSPGNPQANAGWAERVTVQLQEAHIW